MTPRAERLVALERLAKRQEWVIFIAQLYDLGFTADEIRGLVERRYLHRVHRGVYAVGHRQLTRRGWMWAALLACGDTSFLSHRTAAGLRGLAGLNAWKIEVSVVRPGSRQRSNLTIHHLRRPPDAQEVKLLDGLRVSSVERLFVELAPGSSLAQLDQMLQLAARKNILHVDKMEAAIARHAGAGGMAKLRAAIADYRPRPFDKSGLERVVAAAIAADPSIPTPERNIYLKAGGISWEIDFFWRGERVALEVDGGQYHLTPQDKEKDRIKDAKLMAVGITPLRVTDVRWDLDAAGAMDDLRTILRLRSNPAA